MMAMYPDMSNMARKGYYVPAMNPVMSPTQMKFGQFGMMMPPIPGAVLPNAQAEVVQDKILRDQNFLSSDEKLYDGIAYHGLSLKNVFAECQFSEKLLGSYLFRAIKKNVFDPNTSIFYDSTKTASSSINGNNGNNFGIKEIEIVENNIIDIIQDKGKVPIMPDTSDIFKKVMENKQKRNGKSINNNL
jgi:hypothetical protein